jgi:hypothetical protein
VRPGADSHPFPAPASFHEEGMRREALRHEGGHAVSLQECEWIRASLGTRFATSREKGIEDSA